MTERSSEPDASGRRMTTGEFRTAPDASGNTAQFQAFAQQGDPTAEWNPSVPERSQARRALLIAGVVVLVALIVIIAVTLA